MSLAHRYSQKVIIDYLVSMLLNDDMSLTNNDLKLIKDVMKVTIDEELDVKLEEKLEEKIKYLPNKEEFYEKMDEIVSELKAMRDEQTLLSHRVYENHEPRIEKVEKNLGIQTVV
jgi:hypothetical protein